VLTTFKPAPQAARVSADGDGFLVAWSEVDQDGIAHGYAGRMNAAGQLTTIGVRTSGVADAPAVARFGDRYIAAWLEPEPDGRPMLVTGALDRDFKVVAARPIGLTSGPPIVRATETRAYVGSGNFLYEVDRDAAPVTVYDLPQPIDDLTVMGNDVGYVHHDTAVTAFPCILGCGHYPIIPKPPVPRYYLTFTRLYWLTTTASLIFDSRAPSAVASGGDEFLVVFADSAMLSIKGAIVGSTIEPFLISPKGQRRFDAQTQPQAAWDGTRWVAVWDSGLGIEGAVIAPDHNVTPFNISAEGARPSIAASKPGRFLITYETTSAGRKLVSRLIDFTSPNQRERVIR